ncbi:MAG: DNA polymerase Y family protein [Acidimicrobiia bacterium]|nr:DNA polymerase Y family protein [Acidimicrobiia bacterium]
MERVMCIWWETWALFRPDAPSDKPCVVTDNHHVVAANQAARTAGVVRGMKRRSAEAICPGGLVLDRDISAELARFEPVVRSIEDLVPMVEVAEPGLIFFDIAGAVAFYGGERELVELVAKTIQTRERPRIGVANSPFAARRAAGVAHPGGVYAVTDDATFLTDVAIDSLTNQDLVATFRWLGISTLGQLSQLPRDTIVSRFGAEGLRAHQLASGQDRSTQPRAVPVDVFVEQRFEDPLERLEQVGFAARAAAAELVGELRRNGSATHRVEVEAEAADGAIRLRVWRNADPFDEGMLAERVWWQLRAWIESHGITGGMVRLRLSPADVSGGGRQLGFFEDTMAVMEADRALARVQALIGPDQVLGAVPQGGRDPADRVSWHRWGELPELVAPTAPWPGATPGPSPALVTSQRIEVEWDEEQPTRVRLRSRWEPVLNWAGPWRRTGRWWTGEPDADRYQLVTSAGALLCERRDGGMYLTGLYD